MSKTQDLRKVVECFGLIDKISDKVKMQLTYYLTEGDWTPESPSDLLNLISRLLADSVDQLEEECPDELDHATTLVRSEKNPPIVSKLERQNRSQIVQPTQGQVFWVHYPDPDKTNGSEQGKTRPCVVVSNELNNKFCTTVNVVPCTSSRNALLPSQTKVDAQLKVFLAPTITMAEQIDTVEKTRLREPMGFLCADDLDEVLRTIHIQTSPKIRPKERP